MVEEIKYINTNEPIEETVSEVVAEQPKPEAKPENKLKSRKLWAFIFGVISLFVSNFYPELSGATTEITALVATYILGQGAVDVMKVK